MSKKILLVEDEALIAMNEAQMLQKHGYEVITVHNGEKSIETVDSDPDISLILMDIDLGKGLDGTEAAEQILERHDIPVVFLSSHTEPEIVEKTEGITSYGYIVKNSGETVLLASLRMAFRLYEAHMELKRQKENLNSALIQYEQTAEELAEREALYRNLMENSIDGVELLDEDGNYLNVNKKECEMLGYSREELLSMKIADIDPNYPKDGFYRFWKEQPKGTSILFETLHRHKNGTLIPVEVNGIFFKVGNKKYIFGVARDIRERKRSEYEIKAREKNLRTTLNSIGDAVISTDFDGKIVQMNPVAENLCGWSSDEVKGKALKEVFHIVHADTGEKVENPVAKVLETGKVIGLANHTLLISKDGTEYQIADSAAPIVDDNAHTTGVVLVFRDVSEEYKKERQLKESEEKYFALFNQAVDAIYLHDSEGNIIDVNAVVCEQTGYSKSELLQLSVFDIHVTGKDSINMSTAETKRIWKQSKVGDRYSFELEHKRKDGTIFPVRVSTGAIRYGNKNIIMAIVLDITEHKQAEEALQNSRNLLDATQRVARVGGWEWDVERQTMTWADQTYLIHGFEPGEFAAGSPEHIQRSLACYDPDDQPKIEEAFRKCVEEGVAYSLELPLTTSQGRRIWVQTSAQAVLNNGRVVKVQGHIMDITERRRAEEKMREALKEKDFLMKELNHRVKNNLNMVSSLISLKDSEIEPDLSDIKHQTEAIGLIHEKLYRTENVTEICCRDYFDDLLNSIFSTFTTRQVRTVESVEDLCVSTKTAMTLGLIINEIATNAIKHGFCEKEEAVFTIEMKKDTENNQYELTLSNTGNLFPEDIDIESTETLGLRLINTLVAQIEGTIKLKKKPKPVFTIRFPIGEE